MRPSGAIRARREVGIVRCEQWGLAKWARLSPELEQRLAYNAAVTGSYEKAAEHSKRWGTAISDDAIHALVGRVAERNKEAALPPPAPPKPQEQPFCVVIMIDGWMVRQRGRHWGVEPGSPSQERVSWKEVKSAILYRLEDRVANASGATNWLSLGSIPFSINTATPLSIASSTH